MKNYLSGDMGDRTRRNQVQELGKFSFSDEIPMRSSKLPAVSQSVDLKMLSPKMRVDNPYSTIDEEMIQLPVVNVKKVYNPPKELSLPTIQGKNYGDASPVGGDISTRRSLHKGHERTNPYALYPVLDGSSAHFQPRD